MDYRLNRVAPWIHIYTIAKILGVILFVLSVSGMNLPKAMGPSSYYIAWLTVMFSAHLAIAVSGFLATLLAIACELWFLALPICIVIFYIRFLRKDSVKPYFVLIAIESLFVIGWFLYALLNGIWTGEIYFLLDAFGTIAVAVGMAVSYLRKPI